MSFGSIYVGWDLPGKLSRALGSIFFGIGLRNDNRAALAAAQNVQGQLQRAGLTTAEGQRQLAEQVANATLQKLSGPSASTSAYTEHLTEFVFALMQYEGWFTLPASGTDVPTSRSELWELEHQLQRVSVIATDVETVKDESVQFLADLIGGLAQHQPAILAERPENDGAADLQFAIPLLDLVADLPAVVEAMLEAPFRLDAESDRLFPHLRGQLKRNLYLVNGTPPELTDKLPPAKLPTKQSAVSGPTLIDGYLGRTPLPTLFEYDLKVTLPLETRFEHHHIIAGSGHGKTQTLQALIAHDLEAVAKGERSIVVMDSQSDLINNIAGLDCFAPDGSLADRLVVVDPTDIEWPVALNLFDVGQERLEEYTPLERERLTNSLLELYDFVLSTLLDAGMTQKQNVIFRYITRLLLTIPHATIHTLREVLEPDGFERFEPYIKKLSGSARAFFETEFTSNEFKRTKQQVLRRLYGILENQTFERMFSHPKSKLDLFTEMNAGKVILINTAKDLLKESGTEVLGRFFIALIAQAAQERAVLPKDERMPTLVYIDEASDYFDQNIGIILSQARKYKVGMILVHQYLGQLDNKLHEAIAANTSVKFAGGVSAKDARGLANDLRTDASFIEGQAKLSFAAFIKGQADRAVSLKMQPGQIEALPRMTPEERNQQRETMRQRYAVHYSELGNNEPSTNNDDGPEEDGPDDNGEPMAW